MHFFNLSACILLAKQALKTEDEGWEKQKQKPNPPPPPPSPLLALESINSQLLFQFNREMEKT